MLTIHAILDAAAAHYGIETTRLVDRQRRGHKLAHMRQAAWWVARRARPDVSYPRLARYSGGYDHTTVMYGVAAVDQRRRDDREVKLDTDALLKLVAAADALPRLVDLGARDAEIVRAILSGWPLDAVATLVGLSLDDARDRATEIAQALAAALGRGLTWAELYSHKPDRLLVPDCATPAPVAETPPADVIEGEAFEVAAELLAALPPPVIVPAPPPPAAAPKVARPSRRDNPGRPGLSEEAEPPPRPRDVPGGAPGGSVSTPSVVRRPPQVVGGAPARRSTGSPKVFAYFGSAPPSFPVQPRERDHVSDADRALIDAAVAAGKLREVHKDDGTELVYDTDIHAWARLPRDQCELVPEHGWRKRSNRNGWGAPKTRAAAVVS